MLRNISLVAKREYLKTIKRRSFWITTFAFPIFMVVIFLISGYSAESAEQRVKEQASKAHLILVIDDANLINPSLVSIPLQFSTDFAAATEQVRTGEADAAIHYPADFLKNYKYEMAIQDQGLLGNGYGAVAENLVKQSILLSTGRPELVTLFNATYANDTVTYKNGEVTNASATALIVPGVAVILYFLLINFSASYLLLSVSEEKENRMIEIVLSAIKPRELIWGKIAGQLAVVLTQLGTLAIFATIGLVYLNSQNPIDFSVLNISPIQILVAVFYTICGFLIMASIMVGVGAAMPTYREAQSFSSVFILMSVFPVYLATSIIAEPSGTISQVFSYFPFTSALILLFRNALGELSLLETIVSSLVLLIYVVVSFVLAFKMFEFGSLEYASKVNFQGFLRTFRLRN